MPKVVISLDDQSGQYVSGDNSRRNTYITDIRSNAALGFFLQTLNSFPEKCAIGLEFAGTVTPSTYAQNIQLHRTILSEKCYYGTTLQPTCDPSKPLPPRDDTSDTPLRDDAPQSCGPVTGACSVGKVYDLDAPGLNEFNDTAPLRWRVNFQEYATLADGVTKVSPDFDYYLRISCLTDSNGHNNFNLDYGGDDKIDIGCTSLSADLSGSCP